GLYQLGRSDALATVNYATAISTVKTLRDKGVIYAQVSHSAADALCRDYGLPENDIPKCVLGVREASAKP
ncbi:hypothetical protein ACTGU5_12090, partial [Streptococcus suis]